jgi:sugar (pentulose or hexulose) kinase
MLSQLSLIALNIGTSKLVVASAESGHPPYLREHQLSSQEPGQWLQVLERALSSLPKSKRVKVLSVCGTSGSFLLVGENGEPIARPVLYNEVCSDALSEVRARLSTLPVITSSLTPGSGLVMLYRLWHSLSPKQQAEVRWVVPQSVWLSYVIQRGVGVRWDQIRSDISNCRKLGSDVLSLTWPEHVLQLLGIPVHIFPTLVESGTELGTAASALAAAAGLSGTRILHGTTDASADAMGLIGDSVGGLGVMAGSTTSIKGVLDHRAEIGGFGYFSAHPMDPDKHLYTAWVSVGENIRALSLASGVAVSSLLQAAWDERVVHQQIPFIELRPEPVLASYANLDPVLLCRGLTEAAAYWESYHIREFERLWGRPLQEVKMVGGTARCQEWVKFRASCYERTITRHNACTALGCLLPGLKRNHLLQTSGEFFHMCNSAVDRIEPEPLSDREHQQRHMIWDRLSRLS